MKRFQKLGGPKPESSSQVLTLPEPKIIWGSQFNFPGGGHSISWICHNAGLFAVIKKGQVSIRSEYGSVLLSAESAIYIPPECAYVQQELGAETSGCFISIPTSDCANLPSKIVLLRPSSLLIALAVRFVEQSGLVGNLGRRTRLASVFIDELQDAPMAETVLIPMPHSVSIRNVAEEIISSPCDMKCINVWAKSAGMSRRSFTRAFHEEVGLSFALWRRRVKVAAAIKALERGMSIADISFSLGYQNPSSFNAAFKKQFGLSPTEFLKSTLSRPRATREAG